jgi:hypothetical protein
MEKMDCYATSSKSARNSWKMRLSCRTKLEQQMLQHTVTKEIMSERHEIEDNYLLNFGLRTPHICF